jgi:hypothetical protein
MATQPIVYCQKCGIMVSPGDLVSRKAITLAGLYYCAQCNPLADEKPAPGVVPAQPVKVAPPSDMVFLTCACGKKMQVRKTLAGKKIKCPACSQIIAVPVTETPQPIAAPQKVAAKRFVPQSGSIRPSVKSQVSESKADSPIKSRYMTRPAKKPIPKLYLIGGAAVLLLAIIGYAMYSASETKKAAEQKRQADAEDAYNQVMSYEKSNLLKFRELLDKIVAAKDFVKKTEYADKLTAKEQEANINLEVFTKVDETDQQFSKNPTNYSKTLESYVDLKSKSKSSALTDEINQRIQAVQEKYDKELADQLGTLSQLVKVKIGISDFKGAATACDTSVSSYLLDDPKTKESVDKIRAEIKTAEDAYLKKLQEGQVLFDSATTVDQARKDWRVVNCAINIDNEHNLVITNNTPQPAAFAFAGSPDWQDYEAEITYRESQGSVTILVRCEPNKTDARPYGITPERKFGDTSWKTVKLSIIGTELTVSGYDQEPPKIIGQARKGCIGFMLRSGGQILIKELKVRHKI